MKKRVLMRFFLLSGTSISALVAWISAASLPLASAAAPSASASASASAASSAPSGPPERPAPIELLEKQTIPTTPSPVPKLDEWKAAPAVEVARRDGYRTNACTVYRVREWLKVRCEMSVGAIYEHSGNPEGIAFWVRPIENVWANMEQANGGEVIFPLKVGDRRLIQFFALQHDPCIGMGYGPSVMVDETWLEGEPGPIVVLR
jgi:hypothetical protein